MSAQIGLVGQGVLLENNGPSLLEKMWDAIRKAPQYTELEICDPETSVTESALHAEPVMADLLAFVATLFELDDEIARGARDPKSRATMVLLKVIENGI